MLYFDAFKQAKVTSGTCSHVSKLVICLQSLLGEFSRVGFLFQIHKRHFHKWEERVQYQWQLSVVRRIC